jgi:hypothetical protein
MRDSAYRLTDHARQEAARRGITFDVLLAVIEVPDQIVDAHSGRKAYQSQVIIDVNCTL